MSDDVIEATQAGCTCWQVPTDGGGTVPAAELMCQDTVKVTRKDGQVVNGEVADIAYLGSDAGRPVAVLVFEDEDAIRTCDIASVRSRTVEECREDSAKLGDFLRDYVETSAVVPADGSTHFMRLPLGGHEYLLVSLSRRRIPCRGLPADAVHSEAGALDATRR